VGAMKICVTAVEALREKERGDEIQVYQLACTFYIDGRKIRWRYHLPMSDKVILVALWFFPQASCCLGPFFAWIPFAASALIILFLEILIFFQILFFSKKIKNWKENEEFI